MKKVKIINGTYGHRPEGAKFITPVKADEVVEVSDTEAVRLVGLGIAVCIVEDVLNAVIPPVATPPSGENGGGQGETPPEGDEGAESGVTEEGGALDIVSGHFTVESLMEMTRANMENLAVDLGVDISKCKNKSDIAALMATVEVEVSQTPPDLGAADPVI